MTTKKTLSKEEAVESIAEFWNLFSKEDQATLYDEMFIQGYRKNEVIYFEGEEPSTLMCLLQGRVKIYRKGTGVRRQIVRISKPIQYFGFRASFVDECYKTEAAAFEHSIICHLPMETIINCTKRNNALAMFFIQLLSTELGMAEVRAISLTQKHIRARIAETLLFLKENYGLEEDGATLSIYLSREDLANMSNMTASNAIRTLSSLSEEKLIAIDGRKIKIIEEDRLRRISKTG